MKKVLSITFQWRQLIVASTIRRGFPVRFVDHQCCYKKLCIPNKNGEGEYVRMGSTGDELCCSATVPPGSRLNASGSFSTMGVATLSSAGPPKASCPW